jgi:3-oxoacyl-[acyl-carrier-protein] synthase-3
MVDIKGFGTALPERVVSAEEIARWTGGDAEFIANKVGIHSRRFLSPDERPLDLAGHAVTDLFTRHEIKAEDIDLVVFVTQNPDYRLPQNSSLLCDLLNLDTTVASFDISLGCSGWVYGISIAKGFMLSENRRNALLVTCDPYSRIMNRNDRSTVTVFGDAATSTWLTHDGDPNSTSTIGYGDYGTDGGRGHQLGISAGGAAFPLVSIDSDASQTPNLSGRNLYMSGRKILEFMVRRVPQTVDRCLANNQMTRDDVDLFVFHQASAYMIERLIGVMQLDPAKVPIAIKHTGNTVSSSIPLVLNELAISGQLSGKRVLVSGFGVGLSWASNIIDFRLSAPLIKPDP